VELLVGKYAGDAGLDGVMPHILRHSFDKHLHDQGAGLVAVAALLGHQRLKTTANYTTLSDRSQARAVERLSLEVTSL
jgi:site-specific recombinase XerD